MKETFLRTMRCPQCKSDELRLEIRHQDTREIRDATLQCCQCHHSYVVSNGIINFLPDSDAVIKNEVEGWLQLAGPLDDGLVPIMAALPYYPHEPWIHLAPDFVQAFELVSFAGRRVLDIGAGRCWSSRHILTVGKALEVVALDILRDRYIGLETADLYMDMDNIYFERVLGSMNNMPFCDQEFDVVFSAATVHHSSDLEGLFQEVKRVLRPQGAFLMISEPCKKASIPESRPDNEETRHGINEHIYALPEYLRPLRRHGFKPRVVAPRSIFYRLSYPDDAFTQNLPRLFRRLGPTLRLRLVRALLSFYPTAYLVYRYWSLPLTVVAEKVE